MLFIIMFEVTVNCVSTFAVVCRDHFIMVLNIRDIFIVSSDIVHTFDPQFGHLLPFSSQTNNRGK